MNDDNGIAMTITLCLSSIKNGIECKFFVVYKNDCGVHQNAYDLSMPLKLFNMVKTENLRHCRRQYPTIRRIEQKKKLYATGELVHRY